VIGEEEMMTEGRAQDGQGRERGREERMADKGRQRMNERSVVDIEE
jgi:hypothetical protein